MSFDAKYAGTCNDCGERFEAGTEIRYDDADDIVHADPAECSLSQTSVGARDKTCQLCFLVHRGECF